MKKCYLCAQFKETVYKIQLLLKNTMPYYWLKKKPKL